MNLLLRADADIRMGTGHVMRCLALAQAWQDKLGKACLATARLCAGLGARWTAEGLGLEKFSTEPGSADDAEQTIALARRLDADRVVLDGYHFSTRFQRALKQAGLRLLVIDDFGHAEHYAADLVLNQNLHAEEEFYRQREPYTRLLLGTRFALLRREFRRWRDWQREIPKTGRKILVTLGGSDPDNVTGKVIQALQQVRIEGLEAIILAGASNPHHADLEALLAGSAPRISLHASVTDMPGLMAWADVAVAAGGTTSWERAFLGLPSLVLILADNQQQMAEAAEQAGIGWNLGPAALLSVPAVGRAVERLAKDAGARAQMAQRGPEVVDGLGPARVVHELQDADIWVRPACAADCRLVWEWANDPGVRAVSFNTEAISWERHQEWFAAKLNDPACVLFIGLSGPGVPIGQVRYDINDKVAVLSVSVDSRVRGAGYGPALLRKSSESLFQRGNVEKIHAYIRHGNDASYKALAKAGYQKVADTVVHGQAVSLLVLGK